MSYLQFALHLFLQRCGVSRVTSTWQICLRARFRMFVTCAGKSAHKTHNCPKQQFPWRPTLIDHVKKFLLCSEFRSAVQLTVGKSCDTQFVPCSHLQCASLAAPTDFAPAAIKFALTCTGSLLHLQVNLWSLCLYSSTGLTTPMAACPQSSTWQLSSWWRKTPMWEAK